MKFNTQRISDVYIRYHMIGITTVCRKEHAGLAFLAHSVTITKSRNALTPSRDIAVFIAVVLGLFPAY